MNIKIKCAGSAVPVDHLDDLEQVLVEHFRLRHVAIHFDRPSGIRSFVFVSVLDDGALVDTYSFEPFSARLLIGIDK